jgi:pectate lyase
MAFRSLIGSCATLTTSVANLTVLMVLKGEPGWICLMICNADILFCVLVLHWATSKEQKPEDSAFRSHTGPSGYPRSGGAKATIGSHNARSYRVSTAVDDEREKSPVKLTVTTLSEDGSKSVLQGPATVTTECKGLGGVSRARQGGSSWDAGEVKSGVREDEVELRNIHVHTTQTREVEVDVMKMSDGASTTDGEGDDWVGSRRGVVGERMV